MQAVGELAMCEATEIFAPDQMVGSKTLQEVLNIHMNILKTLTVSISFLILLNIHAKPIDTDLADHLQNVSVTIRAENQSQASSGSGVIITRKIGDEQVTFVWTCGHVIDHMRTVRTVIRSGQPVKLVEFGTVQIVKEIVEQGRKVGEIKMDAEVIKYSDPDDGHDLALLMVRAKDYGKANTDFYLNSKEPIVGIGEELYHVGSLLGQQGANSMTRGIVSQVGRLYGKVEYDQTTATAFPGSSGGGVFLKDGSYVGMIVRGAGEGFNLYVPVRRMIRWAEEHDIMWAIDTKTKAPMIKDIVKLPVESTTVVNDGKVSGKFNKQFPYHVYTVDQHIGTTSRVLDN